MKWCIKICQKTLWETSKSLDLVDGAILDYIKGIYRSKKIKTRTYKTHLFRYEEHLEGGIDKFKEFKWVDYGTMASSLPMAKITTTSPIQKRINKLIKLGFIRRIIVGRDMPYLYLSRKMDMIQGQTLFSPQCENCTLMCENCTPYIEKYLLKRIEYEEELREKGYENRRFM